MSSSQQTSLGTGDAFSSVLSSLQNQRRRLEVISTNISNINTIGFKSSRMTFLEMLGQTVGKLYTPFEQGSFTATGSPTDIAVQGRSFFIIRGGDDENMFTRAGSFYFDQDGRLVNQDRLAVQGWTLNEVINGVNEDEHSVEIGSMGAIGDIVLDPDMTVGAQATTNIWLGGNLNAGKERVTNVLTSTDILNNMTGTITEPADDTTLLSDVSQFSTISTGDTIEISGTFADGTAFGPTYGTLPFTYTGTETVGDFLGAINAALGSNATATLEGGAIVITDTIPGDSQTSMNFNYTGTGTVTLPGFEVSESGYTPKAETSLVVYDSFGTAHHLTIEFTISDNMREWNWKVIPQGNETIVQGPSNNSGTGQINFDPSGNFVSMTFEDGTGILSLDPGNGAAQMTLNLNAGGGPGITGITQYNAETLLGVRHQDGQPSGKLEGISVDEDGYVTGSFSNGVIMKLAQLAVAEFDDPTSMEKSGASNFMPTNNSGDPEIGRASDFDTTLMSGHLEQSNVDLADQFIQMIDAQKGYQAASRIVSTLDRILEETTRFGR